MEKAEKRQELTGGRPEKKKGMGRGKKKRRLPTLFPILLFIIINY